MGGSTDVPLVQRMSTWVELVPRLLAYLGIQHVALASHSAGTMYLLNTLYHCRDLLYPNNPVINMLGMLFILLGALFLLACSSGISKKHVELITSQHPGLIPRTRRTLLCKCFNISQPKHLASGIASHASSYSKPRPHSRQAGQ